MVLKYKKLYFNGWNRAHSNFDNNGANRIFNLYLTFYIMKDLTISFLIASCMLLNFSCTQSVADESNTQDGETWYSSSAEYLNKVTTNTSGEPIVYPEGQATISSKFIVWEPGFETGVHKHPVPIAVAIYQGELTVEFENGETLVTKAGESYVSTPDLWHKSSNQGTEDLIGHLVVLGTDQVEYTIPKE